MSAHCETCGADLVHGTGEDWQSLTCQFCDCRAALETLVRERDEMAQALQRLDDLWYPMLASRCISEKADGHVESHKRWADFCHDWRKLVESQGLTTRGTYAGPTRTEEMPPGLAEVLRDPTISYDGEICRDCRQPVVDHSGSFWSAPDDLWDEVWGAESGILCQPCFVARARSMGIHVAWLAHEYHRWEQT